MVPLALVVPVAVAQEQATTPRRAREAPTQVLVVVVVAILMKASVVPVALVVQAS